MTGCVSEITLIIPLNFKVGAVIVVVHTNLLVKHVIGPEPETAEVFIILEDIELFLNRTEPISDLSRDVEWSAVNILIAIGSIVAEHANLGKILLDRVLEVDEEITELGVLITDGIIEADKLGGLEGDGEEVLHEVFVEASLTDIVAVADLGRSNSVLPETHVWTSLLLDTRDPVLGVKRARADSLLVPGADFLHPISHRVRSTATTTIGAGAVGEVVPAVTDDETTGLTLLGGELIVVTNNIHSVATLTESLTVHEELTVHVEHGRENTGASLGAIVTVGWALHGKTGRALNAALPVRIVAREEVGSVVHFRRPGKRTVVLNHETLGFDDIVSRSHRLDVKPYGVVGKSLLHAGTFKLVIRISVRTNRRRKNLGVHFLKVVKPPDFTTLSAVMENKITNNITNIRMILASFNHSNTVSLLVKTHVLVLLQELLLDTILTIALLKNTNGGKVPAGTTILLIITRSLILGSITIRKIIIVLYSTNFISVHHTTSTSSTLRASITRTTNSINIYDILLNTILGCSACTTCIVSNRNTSKKQTSDYN